jgi:hypothetical protein
MKVLSAFFKNSDSEVVVTYESNGKLKVARYLISRTDLTRSGDIHLRVETDGTVTNIPATKAELQEALKQAELDYAEWKALYQAGQVEKAYPDWVSDRLVMRARLIEQEALR